MQYRHRRIEFRHGQTTSGIAYRISRVRRSCGSMQQKLWIPETWFLDLSGKRGVEVTTQRIGSMRGRESEIRGSSESRPREYRFPDRRRGRHGIDIPSGFGELWEPNPWAQDSRTSQFRFPDKVKGEHRRSILWVQKSLEKGFWRAVQLFGTRKEKFLVEAGAPSGRLRHRVYSNVVYFLLALSRD